MQTPHTHFKNAYSTKAFFPPDDIRYVVYSSDVWSAFLNLITPKSKIIDLGCGNGTLLHCLYKLGFTDLSALDFVNSIPRGFVPKVKFTQSDVLKTHFSNNSFDALVSTMVIEHVDDQKFAKEIFRLLKPDGIALVTSIILETKPWYFYRNDRGVKVLEPSHLREYSSLSQFLKLFTQFNIIKTQVTPLKYPLIDPIFFILNKLIRSDYLRNLPTTSPLFKRLRYLRIPIPGYYAIEIIVQKKTS